MFEMDFTWVPFFEELADKLLTYKNDRQTLIIKVREAHKIVGKELPKIESNNENILNIDPFTVFALFNRGKQSDTSRKTLCTGYKKVFEIVSELPNDFNGIPMYAYNSYCFYRFVDGSKRNDNSFDILWDLFEKAINYSKDVSNYNSFVCAFDKAISLDYVGLSKLTMGLFQIRPNKFLNLDKRNVNLIQKNLNGFENIDKILDCENYIKLCNYIKQHLSDVFNCSNLPEFSFKAFTEDNLNEKSQVKNKDNKNMSTPTTERDFSKNTILYGPPGTGKTYNTVNYAVAIIEGKPLEKVQNEEYENVFQRYKEYKQKGFIEFTSFHQSYGYEEFIEGIKPVIDFADDQQKDVQYEISSGLFKSFCDKALQPVFKNQKQELGVNDSPTIWKVSLESTYENKTRTECLKNNHIRIGYDSYGETITNDMNFDCGGKYILNAFISNMRIGDIVMSCYNNTTIDAIGVVTGDYEWHSEYEKYKRLRKVNWLVKNIREDILDINNGVTFTLSTVYRLKISLKDVMDIIKKYSNFKNFVEEKKKNYVFIIDEINRGNISKIFGELITLIEETKRIGKSEELKVRLPYSKEVFGVPNNVYILGTMNTSDRSIAAIDTALRRRFSFKEMLPNANLLKGVKVGDVDIEQMLEVMNKKITALYDREHTIGHSYLLPLKKDNSLDNLANIFENKIIPLLQEYFFEDYEKIQLVLGDNYKDDTNKFIVKHTDNFNALFGSGDSDNYADDFITYEINKEAFHNIESYKAICRTGEKNEKVISNN